jgi:hypothetical protein
MTLFVDFSKTENLKLRDGKLIEVQRICTEEPVKKDSFSKARAELAAEAKAQQTFNPDRVP